ncbi:hypothetical protein P3S67_031945 [Capsicum chacoense]
MVRIPINPSAPPDVTSDSQVSSLDVCTPPLPPSTGSNLSFDKPFLQTTPDSNLSFSRTTFTYQELTLATDNFSVSNLLGQGGFGYVYKGVLHSGRSCIKQLKAGSGQGEREFQAERQDHPPLSWETRMRITLCSARGLAFLHEECHPKIIHRDIKASNILVDDNFDAKVADFGLARLTYDTDTLSPRVMGTFGYLAPDTLLLGTD